MEDKNQQAANLAIQRIEYDEGRSYGENLKLLTDGIQRLEGSVNRLVDDAQYQYAEAKRQHTEAKRQNAEAQYQHAEAKRQNAEAKQLRYDAEQLNAERTQLESDNECQEKFMEEKEKKLEADGEANKKSLGALLNDEVNIQLPLPSTNPNSATSYTAEHDKSKYTSFIGKLGRKQLAFLWAISTAGVGGGTYLGVELARSVESWVAGLGTVGYFLALCSVDIGLFFAFDKYNTHNVEYLPDPRDFEPPSITNLNYYGYYTDSNKSMSSDPYPGNFRS